ncbi:MAG: hypothetical protein NT003_02805 [Candidatus Magasanikbacteria bacterium]|nr:hypothetical protein [Candidatus Magasanikbacteria bacterium]
MCETARRESFEFIKWVDNIPVYAAHSYDCTPVAAAIRAVKYGRVRDAAELCGTWVQPIVARVIKDVTGPCVIIPVPLHLERFAERGFNQAELLARAAVNSNMVIDTSLLQRTVYTHAQAESNEEERQKQIQKAFSVSPGRRCDAQMTYMIFDDVVTTGSTIRDCARALRASGAEKILGITIAGT